ncbi:tRNA-dihydrouridine(20/20a) synthase, partial [Dictyocoela roeselum]
MLDVTTPYFRKLIRLISAETLIFTEMISPDFIIHNKTFTDRLKFLDSRTVIQLGSSDKEKLANAILLLQAVYGSKLKVNLNCGCPSTRVQSGNFGAILMKSNKLVVEIINHVYEKTGIVLSLKIRIGVDDLDSYDFFKEFVLSIVENTPCRIFFVHARK